MCACAGAGVWVGGEGVCARRAVERRRAEKKREGTVVGGARAFGKKWKKNKPGGIFHCTPTRTRALYLANPPLPLITILKTRAPAGGPPTPCSTEISGPPRAQPTPCGPAPGAGRAG